jgi:hypothetical protein
MEEAGARPEELRNPGKVDQVLPDAVVRAAAPARLAALVAAE